MAETVHIPSVTALVVGDPHFKLSNVLDTDAMTKSILTHVRELRPNIIVILGDILDRFETIHISPLSRAVQFLMECLNEADTYLLIGNHDLKNNQQFLSTEHPFASCHLWRHPQHRFTVVDNVVTREVQGRGLSVQMTFIPYVPAGMFEVALDSTKIYHSVSTPFTPNPSSIISTQGIDNEDHPTVLSNSSTLIWKDSRVIFAHQEFYGANYEVGSSITGDHWPAEYPLVVSGHIHDYQRLQENILYTGTPIQHGYDDRHDKTISYLTFTSDSWGERRIALDVKTKAILHINVADVATYQVANTHRYKIVISGTSAEIKGINKHPAIKSWAEQGHTVTYKTLPTYTGLSSTPVTNASNRPAGRFVDVLTQRLSSQPRLLSLFNQIFSSSTQ